MMNMILQSCWHHFLEGWSKIACYRRGDHFTGVKRALLVICCCCSHPKLLCHTCFAKEVHDWQWWPGLKYLGCATSQITCWEFAQKLPATPLLPNQSHSIVIHVCSSPRMILQQEQQDWLPTLADMHQSQDDPGKLQSPMDSYHWFQHEEKFFASCCIKGRSCWAVLH